MHVELQAELLEKGVLGRAEEALEARGRVSPSTGRSYPLTLVCEAWRVPKSSVYALRPATGGAGNSVAGKRGPKTELSDEELVVEIRTVLSESPFVGEGHRKVRTRLAAKGIVAGKNPALRLMRENGLLAPVRRGNRGATGATGAGSAPGIPTSWGARTRRGSGRGRRAGAGSSARWTTASVTSWAGTRRRRGAPRGRSSVPRRPRAEPARAERRPRPWARESEEGSLRTGGGAGWPRPAWVRLARRGASGLGAGHPQPDGLRPGVRARSPSVCPAGGGWHRTKVATFPGACSGLPIGFCWDRVFDRELQSGMNLPESRLWRGGGGIPSPRLQTQELL